VVENNGVRKGALRLDEQENKTKRKIYLAHNTKVSYETGQKNRSFFRI
jgi:hypothetical protein